MKKTAILLLALLGLAFSSFLVVRHTAATAARAKVTVTVQAWELKKPDGTKAYFFRDKLGRPFFIDQGILKPIDFIAEGTKEIPPPTAPRARCEFGSQVGPGTETQYYKPCPNREGYVMSCSQWSIVCKDGSDPSDAGTLVTGMEACSECFKAGTTGMEPGPKTTYGAWE